MEIIKTIFDRQKKSNKIIFALDIGEGFIKALAAEIDEKNKKGTITGRGIASFVSSDIKESVAMDVSQVAARCKKAIGEAYQTKNKIMPEIVFGLSGGILKTVAVYIVYRRPRPEKEITEAELGTMAKKIKVHILAKAQKELYSGGEKSNFKLLNIAITEIRIDGYKVNTTLGFQGKNITLRVIAIYVPSFYIKAIMAAANDLQASISGIFSIPFVLAKTYQNTGNGFGGIIIDIGHETTAISMVRDSSIIGIKTFSIGGLAFTKALARNLNLDIFGAEDKKIKYVARKLLPEEDGKIGRIIKKAAVLWYRGAETALSDFAVTELMSGKIYLTGGGSVLPEILEILSEGGLKNNLPIIENISVNQLNVLADTAMISSDVFTDSAEYNGAVSLLAFLLNGRNGKEVTESFLKEEIEKDNFNNYGN